MNKGTVRTGSQKPPVIAARLLESCTFYRFEFDINADLSELYEYRMRESGRMKANIWIWRQVFFSLFKYILYMIRGSKIMFKNYIKITLRNIRRQLGYSIINISGLAIGMACCIMIFLWVKDELSFDRFHDNSDSLYRTFMRVEGNWYNSNPLALATVLKNDYPEIEKITRYCLRQRNFRNGDYSNYEQGAFVGKDFFDMFSFPFAAGDPEYAFDNRLSIVISEEFADRFFKDEDPLGKNIMMNNRMNLTVTGVLKKVPSNSSLQFDFLAPIELYKSAQRLNTSWSVELWTFIQLKENTDVGIFKEKIRGVVEKYDTRLDHEVILTVQPVREMYLHNIAGGGPIDNVYTFSVIAVLILLIACINFMNLATARSGKRAKEIGMRKVMGAVKANIINQFYGEAMVSTFAGLLCAILLVFLFLPAFNNIAQKELSFGLLMSPEAIISLIVIAVLTGLISGSYPSLLLSSFKPVTVLKASFQSRGKGLNLRRVLVVCQFTATIVLIIGTVIIYRQLDYIRNKDLGLDKENVVSITLNGQLARNYRVFKEELKNNPGVINVSAASNIPTQIGTVNPVYWEGNTTDDYVIFNHVVLDYNYFETYDMKMVYGRSFSEDHPTDKENYIINETALKLTGFEDPIGKMFSIWEDRGEIIGVVKDFHNKSLHSAITPTVFTLRQKHISISRVFVKLQPGTTQETMQFIEELYRKYSTGYPFLFTFVDEAFDSQYGSDRRVGVLFRYFSILAILISCLGLLGMASFMAQERTKEIGIRKAIGATVPNIILMISKEFTAVICIANVIAWPLSYMIMRQMLNNYAYRTNIAIWIFVLTGIAVLATAFITVSFQTIKAAIANPVKSLRYE
ncbi:ABC transporter permease [candidate division KSB1 bacterium]